ncbi:hypothetical protein [Ferruginibacter sp.]|nr:hypothetical protein [Ferruginibacter sp.]
MYQRVYLFLRNKSSKHNDANTSEHSVEQQIISTGIIPDYVCRSIIT